MITPIILSGGIGKRLWPISREQHPKQFMPFYDDKSLLQDTLLRIRNTAEFTDPIIVCNLPRRFVIDLQLKEIEQKCQALLLEVSNHGTAAAITVAALYALQQGTDPILATIPIDHFIPNSAALNASIQNAAQFAQQGKLVTFGIKPTNPDTNYGYIKLGKKLAKGIFSIDKFIEKPNNAVARKFYRSHSYYWNAGILMFRASQLLKEMATYAPKILKACELALNYGEKNDNTIVLHEAALQPLPNIAIDYILLEKTKNLAVAPLKMKLTDIGNWDALFQIAKKDKDNNIFSGDVISYDTKGCYIRADTRLVATVGLNDHIVVETPDVVFIAHRGQSREVNKLLEKMEKNSRKEVKNSTQTFRPWGNYKIIEAKPNYQIKKIIVYPGEIMSLQAHQHRSEHWVVIKGEATILRGNETLILRTNESTYIAPNMKHRIENRSDTNLELIEVQLGDYLGDDDIIRFEDKYGRTSVGV